LSETEGEPSKFIRDLDERANILVLYEDIEYSRSLEFSFIRNGLEDGQRGIYLSPQDAHSSEKLMGMHGIKPKFFKNESLWVLSTSNKKREHIIKTIDDFVKKQRYLTRIVLQHDMFSPEQYGDLLLIESFLASKFEKSDISIVVSYNAEFLSDASLMQKIINLHDHVVFAPTFGKGLVVKMR